MRRWGAERTFNTASMLVIGLIDARRAAKNFSMIAQTALKSVLPLARKEMEERFGTIAGECAIIGLGRLGIERMTAASDVDLIFVFDAPADAVSTGPKSLTATDYFLRMVRRIVTALNARGPEPVLFEIDMALRPSGRSGPAAVSLASFKNYYQESAWTWELMALTKAKVMAGDHLLSEVLELEINAILRRPRKDKDLKKDIVEMRARLASHKKATSLWDLRHSEGGVTDLEFVLQYLLLRELPNGFAPAERPPFDIKALPSLADIMGFSAEMKSSLLNADELFETATQFLKATQEKGFSRHSSGRALTDKLAEVLGADDIVDAEQKIEKTQALVLKTYKEILN